jgi:NAD(P)-dependent dehydrogenase (short-subunit alcohol dehydrogenase family)
MERTIVISGRGTGIGRAIARGFAGKGDWGAIVGRREKVLEETAGELNREAGAERVRWLGRAGRPHDVAGMVGFLAGMVGFLAGEQAAFVTGQVLQVNGGALFGR